MNKQNHLLNQQKQNEQARQQIIQIKFLQLDTTITNTNINFRNNLNKTNKKPSLATNTLHSCRTAPTIIIALTAMCYKSFTEMKITLFVIKINIPLPRPRRTR